MFREPHHEIDTPVSLEHLAGCCSTDRDAQCLLHARHVEAVQGQALAIRYHAQRRQTRGLFGTDIGRARHPGDGSLDLFRERDQCVEIIAKHLYRQVGAHPGNEFVEAHLDGLGELVLVARDGTGSGLELRHQLCPGLVRVRPLLTRLHDHEGIGHVRRHGIGRHLGRTELGEHV